MKMPPGNLIKKIDVCITTGLHVVELHLWLKIALERDSFNFHTDYVPLKAKSFCRATGYSCKRSRKQYQFC